MTPVIYTGAPDIEHGGNLPPRGWYPPIIATRWIARMPTEGDPPADLLRFWKYGEQLGLHGAAVILERGDEMAVLHTSDDVESWLAAGWRITSY